MVSAKASSFHSMREFCLLLHCIDCLTNFLSCFCVLFALGGCKLRLMNSLRRGGVQVEVMLSSNWGGGSSVFPALVPPQETVKKRSRVIGDFPFNGMGNYHPVLPFCPLPKPAPMLFPAIHHTGSAPGGGVESLGSFGAASPSFLQPGALGLLRPL